MKCLPAQTLKNPVKKVVMKVRVVAGTIQASEAPLEIRMIKRAVIAAAAKLV
jgi:hypothetical protein